MNPKELIEYARVWGWTRDDMIVAASLLLAEATPEHKLVRSNCAICGGDKVFNGKPCGNCN